MSDYLTTGFKEQLTTTMNSVMSRAVYEVMKILENTLHDYHMELAYKGEEVTQLKIKLETAELKLKDHESGRDRGIKRTQTRVNEAQREPEALVDAGGQTSGVPDIDDEEPDDWCAPLGCDTMTKQDNIVCPSIRLRQLSIPLWHIPVIKHEVVNCAIESPQKPKDCRRSRRLSALNDKHTQDKKLPMDDEGIQRRPMRNNMKQEHSHQTVYEGLRKRVRNVMGKKQENTPKTKKERRQSAATGSELSQTVHERSHKKCRGCKKVFRYQGALRNHKPFCRKHKKLLAKEAANPPKTSTDEEKTPSASKRQMISKKDSTSSSSDHSELSTQGNESAKKYSCAQCNRKFNFRYKFIEHLRIHTGEKPFLCFMCPKKYRINQSFKMHLMKSHRDEINCIEANGDFAWTEPLEDIEDHKEDFISPSKDTGHIGEK